MGDWGDIVVAIFVILVGVISAAGNAFSKYLARKKAEQDALRRARRKAPEGHEEIAEAEALPAEPAGELPMLPEHEMPSGPSEAPLPVPAEAAGRKVRHVRHAPDNAARTEPSLSSNREAAHEAYNEIRQLHPAPSGVPLAAGLPSQLLAAERAADLPPVQAAPRTALLLDRSDLRSAVVLYEVLGPPLALRDPGA